MKITRARADHLLADAQRDRETVQKAISVLEAKSARTERQEAALRAMRRQLRHAWDIVDAAQILNRAVTSRNEENTRP